MTPSAKNALRRQLSYGIDDALDNVPDEAWPADLRGLRKVSDAAISAAYNAVTEYIDIWERRKIS